jgi:predicted tellurium resistance membrane protein TerC
VVESLTAIFSIIIIDLVLSGDNAVVIGMAARSLSTENRRKAIIFGGAGAIGLRILFTALATVLLGIPYLQAIGGVLLFYIAFKLLRPHGGGHGEIKEAGSLREAIQTIILADVVMSLLGRFPAFLYLGAFVLVHAAVAMVLHDANFEGRFHTVLWQELALSLAITAVIVGGVRLLERTNGARGMKVVSTGADPRG